MRLGAAFFDRHGVLNVDRGDVHDVATFEWLPGACEAIRLLNERGLYVFVVTNQFVGGQRGDLGIHAVIGVQAVYFVKKIEDLVEVSRGQTGLGIANA